MEKKRYIVGLGEVLWDILPEGPKLGGAPANFAFNAAQMGYDALAVSAIGRDALGDEAERIFKENGLGFILPRVGFPTGRVDVALDGFGIPTYTFIENPAWDNIPFTPEMQAVAADCLAVCWGSLAQRSPVSRRTILSFIDTVPADCLKIFDINLRADYYTQEVIEDSMRRCDILKINDDELETVSRMFGLEGGVAAKCHRLIGLYGLRLLILTCGTDGSYVFSADDESFLPTPKVEVADTVGAGDSFTAAFCAALLRGESVPEAHRLAVEVSAYVCTRAGAMNPLPPRFTKRDRSRV